MAIIVEEDTSGSVDQIDNSVNKGVSSEPTADPACTEHPEIVTRHELVEDVRAREGEQLVDGIADVVADAPVRVGRKRNASYQRRLAKREKDRTEKAAHEQQATPTEAAVLPVIEEDASLATDHIPDVDIRNPISSSGTQLTVFCNDLVIFIEPNRIQNSTQKTHRPITCLPQ